MPVWIKGYRTTADPRVAVDIEFTSGSEVKAVARRLDDNHGLKFYILPGRLVPGQIPLELFRSGLHWYVFKNDDGHDFKSHRDKAIEFFMEQLECYFPGWRIDPNDPYIQRI